MFNGITVGIILVFILLLSGMVLTILINALLVPLFKTPKKVLDEIIQVMDLSKESILMDLGSGDGRLLLKAYAQSNCKCIGYDISPIMMIVSKTLRYVLFPFTKDILLEPQDIFKADLKLATHVYCFLDPKSLKILRPKIEEFVKNGGKVYSYKYNIERLGKEKKVILTNSIPLYIY